MKAHEAILTRITSLAHELTYARYCQRYSSASYREEIRCAEIALDELKELVKLMALGVQLPDSVKGYLGIEYNLVDEGFKLFHKDETM